MATFENFGLLFSLSSGDTVYRHIHDATETEAARESYYFKRSLLDNHQSTNLGSNLKLIFLIESLLRNI